MHARIPYAGLAAILVFACASSFSAPRPGGADPSLRDTPRRGQGLEEGALRAAPSRFARDAPAASAPPSRPGKARKARLRRRARWCERYRSLIDGSISYMELPFVAEFWRRGLSLEQLDDAFAALKKTERDPLYRAWIRHRHHLRAADFDRPREREAYREYVGFIVGDPEILALSQQLQEVQQGMARSGQDDLFEQLLQILLDARLPTTVQPNASANRRYRTDVTRYHPTPTEMEGGCTDMRNIPLFTLDQFLAGAAPYVSIALDVKLYTRGKIRYGDEFWIPDLDQKYRAELDALDREHIVFRAVDTGGGFTGKGFRRLDLCVTTDHYRNRHDDGGTTIGEVSLVKVGRRRAVLR